MTIDTVKQAAAAYQGSKTSSQSVKTADIVSIGTGNEIPHTPDISDEPVEKALVLSQGTPTEETELTPERKGVQNESIKNAVEEINRRTNTEAVFGVHDRTNRVTIKIVDKDSKEVIKEIPPEKTLDMIAKVWELAGIIVDEKR